MIDNKHIHYYKWLYDIDESWENVINLITWKILKQNIHGSLHKVVVLFRDKKRKDLYVHRLVAQKYIPNPNNHPVVRHLDNNPLNNHFSNLDWCTVLTNNLQAIRDWLNPTTQKRRESGRLRAICSVKPVMQLTKEWILCRIYRGWAKEASKIIGWCRSSISAAASWVQKTSWGYFWKYTNN